EARRIVRLFTLEGSLAAVGAIFLGALLGIPLFLWFQSIGLDVSHLSEATMPVREKIFLEFRPVEIVSVLTFVVALMVFVAWLPVR
ncbi:MAG: lipoprotein releasing system transmembrane-like protein, partial [Nitrospinae bacterium CG11_big_fil_rev_8_21_14_0_20_56_8]